MINLTSLIIASNLISGLTYTGGIKSLMIGAAAFMLINMLLVPLLKILFLPLNLLTLGLFSWLVNVLALYALTSVSSFVLKPFYFQGITLAGVTIPAMNLTTFWVAVAASFLIGLVSNILLWLID